MTTIETYLDWNIDGIPSDYSETLFNALDKCKASGIITSITKPINIIPGCYNLRLELKNEANQYSLYWIWNNPSCHAKLWYNLSWDNFPKVWDYFSSIAEISTSYIIKIWDEVYNWNLSLPDCPYYYEDIIWWIIYDDTEKSDISINKWAVKWDIKTYEDSKNSNTSSTRDWTNIIKESPPPSKITPPIIIDEKEAQELSNTGIENLESSWSIQEITIETNSWDLNQSEMENIENTNINTIIETWNKVVLPSQKIDSSFYYIWWIIIFLLIIFWVWIFKIYKKN